MKNEKTNITKGGNSMLIYKYTPHNKCHKYDIIKKQELWFANIDSLNDPLDSNLAYRQEYSKDEIKEYWEKFLQNKPAWNIQEALSKWGDSESFVAQQNRSFEATKSQIGVLCMSKNPKNILMWAHYANRHQGIVYEFDADLFGFSKNKDITNNPHHIVYPYHREYGVLSYTKESDDKRWWELVKLLITKARDWECEEEVRFFDFSNKGNGIARKFNPDCLKSIIFGAKTPPDEIGTMIDCCKKNGLNHIRFYKAEFAEGRFELVLNEIKERK